MFYVIFMSDYKYEISTTAYAGYNSIEIVNYQFERFNGTQSNVIKRELFKRKSYVGVLPFDPITRQVILIEQFRIGPMVNDEHPWLLELIAGLIDENESKEQAVHREAKEEANCEISKLIPMYDYYMTPGSSNEVISIYCGITDSTKAGGVFGLACEDEDIKVHVVDFDKAMQMLNNGEIRNASTIIALQWLTLNMDKFKSNSNS